MVYYFLWYLYSHLNISEGEDLRFLIAALTVLVHDAEGGSERSSHDPETSNGGETEFD
jgi:hypothetical protein